MKLWSSHHTFYHPWDVVTQGVWRKYPNELNPGVKAIDVVDREVIEGKLVTTRVFGTDWSFPNILATLLGIPEMCYAFERVTVDPTERTMTLRMMNHTFLGLLAVKETIVYAESSTDSEITTMRHDAEIAVTGIKFHNYFENVIVSGFDQNCVKGREAIENAIASFNEELDNIVTICTPVLEAGNSVRASKNKSLVERISESGITAGTCD